MRRLTGKHRRINAGSRNARLFLLPVLCVAMLLMPVGRSLAQDKSVVLPQSGIHYPGGFDTNTVGVVQGKMFGFMQTPSGPVQFRVDTPRESYIVIASPPWFWKDLDVKVAEGAEVRVRGSKSMGKDGKLYIIGQELEILSSGKVYAFRDDDGYPLWKGARAGSRGAGGFGSPQKRNGGMGDMGRGRR